MMVRAVVSPTVPLGTERVRVCLHAGNTVEEVENLVETLQRWCESVSTGIDREERAIERQRARL